jgi:hypothetical protein
VDKFLKWIEVKPAASITAAKAVEFIKEIIYRFGVPSNIITDNGNQFTTREFKNFCADSESRLTMPQFHTCRVTVELRAQMA